MPRGGGQLGFARRMESESVFPPPGGFEALYGLELLEYHDDLVLGQVAVRDDLRQAFGLVHGGVLASIAETLASLCTAAVVMPEGYGAMGLSNST